MNNMNLDYLLEHYRNLNGITIEEEQEMIEAIKKDSPLSSFVTKVKSPTELFDETYNNPNSTIEEVKASKIAQLRDECEKDILEGFIATVRDEEYFFSFDTEAQMNFNGVMQFFGANMITSCEWTCKHNGEYTRIPLNKTEFLTVAQLAFSEKDGKIKKLRNFLVPIVEESLTKEEVASVVW